MMKKQRVIYIKCPSIWPPDTGKGGGLRAQGSIFNDYNQITEKVNSWFI